jgi:hypothetical protein
MKKPYRWLPLLVLAIVSVSCDSQLIEPQFPTTPTNVTEEAVGTLNPNGGNSHPFVVFNSGSVTATVTALSRANAESTATDALIIGVSLGTWTGSACALATGIFNDQAVVGSTVTGNVSNPGTICLRVYDVGRITENVNYTVQVVHP